MGDERRCKRPLTWKRYFKIQRWECREKSGPAQLVRAQSGGRSEREGKNFWCFG